MSRSHVFNYTPPAFNYAAPQQLLEGGDAGPRTNAESIGMCVTPWPTIYQVPAKGLGTMPLFQLGSTQPVTNNRYAQQSNARNMFMPGLAKLPFGGGQEA